MNYVEVIYLLKGFFESRKALYFPQDEAEKIFILTVKQFKEEKKEGMCFRGRKNLSQQNSKF
jgi:hypothetical protein